MTRPRGRGMQSNVARAIGVSEEPRRIVQTIRCPCGEPVLFDTNGIGQLIERCPSCRRVQLYRGPKMLTREDKEHEQGLTASGNFDGRFKAYGKSKPSGG